MSRISGSRARYARKPDYADERHRKRDRQLPLPARESMRRRGHTFLDTTPVRRWLYGQVGRDFDEVYAEFLSRLQPKYREQYRGCIFWYVAPREEVSIRENGEIWGKHEGRPVRLPYYRQHRFYVDPTSNLLRRLPA